MVRELDRTILEAQGYRVLLADDASEALAVLDAHEGSVHLLLTDVILPGLNGRELYQNKKGDRIRMKKLPIGIQTFENLIEEGACFITSKK